MKALENLHTNQPENEHLLRMLDQGIDDMKARRELPLDDAFQKITELREIKKNFL